MRHKPTPLELKSTQAIAAARSTPAPRAAGERSSIQLEIRRGAAERVIVCRASNDRVVDSYGTVITVEALHDWIEGYNQHRTVALQHDMRELRGIEGRAMIGVGTHVDFTPQLEVTMRITDDATWRLIESGQVRAASLEFVPTDERLEDRTGEIARVYYRLSREPEHCSISVVDVPGVPGADAVEVRASGLSANWAYAVVDPRVLNGEITDERAIASLRWFPHHDPQWRYTDQSMLERAYQQLEGEFPVPRDASLSREDIRTRARAHLDRHAEGLSMRARPAQEERMNRWIKMRAAQLRATGQTEQAALDAAKAEWAALPVQVRTAIEQADAAEAAAAAAPVQSGTPAAAEPAIAAATAPTDGQALEQRTIRLEIASVGAHPAPAAAQAQPAAAPVAPDAEQLLTRGAAQELFRAEMQALGVQPENPLAAIAGLEIRSRDDRMDRERLLTEVLARTLLPQMRGERPEASEVQRVHNMMAALGIQARALSIENNGTVIYSELARQFVVRPQPDVVFRNHMRALGMQGVMKQTFPKFDATSYAFQWNRSSSVGGGSTSAITESDGTPDTFDIEVTELNGATVLPESFLSFNAQGPTIVQDVILPALRDAAQREEDKQFFLSDGTHPRPRTFKGLKTVTGVSAVASSANGDAFTLNVLGAMLRAMPTRYRGNPARLAFYIGVGRGDDIGDILSARVTTGGDTWIQKYANVPGPMPVFEYRNIPVYTVPALPETETQGTSADASTLYLVHRDIPVIGDGLTIRIRPFQRENFVQKLEIQEFVGLGYQWADAIVRRPGVRPA